MSKGVHSMVNRRTIGPFILFTMIMSAVFSFRNVIVNYVNLGTLAAQVGS